jgi:hypothetical protein
MKNEQIKEIEKLFPLEYLGDSRIDGYPYFKLNNELIDIQEIGKYFDISLTPLLEDQLGLAGFPAGEKQKVIIKISGIKNEFDQYLRKKKLIKLDINL